MNDDLVAYGDKRRTCQCQHDILEHQMASLSVLSDGGMKPNWGKCGTCKCHQFQALQFTPPTDPTRRAGREEGRG